MRGRLVCGNWPYCNRTAKWHLRSEHYSERDLCDRCACYIRTLTPPDVDPDEVLLIKVGASA